MILIGKRRLKYIYSYIVEATILAVSYCIFFDITIFFIRIYENHFQRAIRTNCKANNVQHSYFEVCFFGVGLVYLLKAFFESNSCTKQVYIIYYY